MAGFFSKMKERLAGPSSPEMRTEEEGYVELGAEQGASGNKKVTVRPFTLEDFDGVKPILDALREGHTICLINIKPLKDKDIVELKRSINKLKKTCDAIEGDIAGFGDNWIAATPPFASIYRQKQAKKAPAEEQVPEVTEYD